MTKQKQRLVVVLGMHRSGTSVVTRALKVMGVELGEQLLEPLAGVNAKGFWEDRDIYLLNVEMLAVFDMDWFHLSNITPANLKVLQQQGFFERAVALLQEKTRNISVFGFKDPRMSKLLTFWLPVFHYLNFDVSYILVIRHPLSVAHSLAERDMIPATQSHLMWLGHTLCSLTNSDPAHTLIVNYDSLMQAPEVALSQMAKRLALHIDPSALQSYTHEFLSQSLRHTVYQLKDLTQDTKGIPLLKDVYLQLATVAKNNSRLDDSVLLDQITRWQYDFQQLHAPMQLLDQVLADHKVSTQSVTQQLKQLAQLQLDLKASQQQNTELTQEVSQLTLALSASQQQTVTIQQHSSHYQEEITSLKQTLFNISHDLGLNAEHGQWVVIKPLKFYQQCLWIRPGLFIKRKLHWLQHNLSSYLPLYLHSAQNFKALLSSYTPRLFRAQQNIAGQSSEYVDMTQETPLANPVAKIICFYLPQFHTIPENNQWWGKGFTEWSSVRSAEAQFTHHYQPHIPAELGYYNLLNQQVQLRQIELAKLYGIGGFCFYFYWFAGKRLLEAPIKSYLDNSRLDLPFCLCWANESWNRGWDGYANDILIEQHHSAEDDIAFIEYISQYLRDHRYIRIAGKPLLLVYRPGILPTPKATTERWRHWCRANGLGEIYLAYVQSFESMAPEEMGFDATIEFPPNICTPTNISHSIRPLKEDFKGSVYDWRSLFQRSQHYQRSDYPLFRGVCPSWDNTARRKNTGTIFLHSKPSLFQRWLQNALLDTVRRFDHPDERLVFINAWNEWAEGAHLEPDMQYGYAWLQATRNALLAANKELCKRKIIVVSHDAHPHGAQYLSLYIVKTLAAEFNFQVDLVLLGDGVLASEYAHWATVHNLHGVDAQGEAAQALAQQLVDAGHSAAIVNTTVSGFFLHSLHNAGLRCVALIHELSGVIKDNRLEKNALAISQYADTLVFPNLQVAHSFCGIAPVPDQKLTIRPQGLYKHNAFVNRNLSAQKQLRQSLGLADTAKIVLCVGYIDYRKGIDRFVEAGILLAKNHAQLFFVWVGHWDMQIRDEIELKIAQAQLSAQFIFVGRQQDTDMYYAGADVYALTSREDPFPSVVMESLQVSVPVVGFKDSGGFDTLLMQGCGLLAEKNNIPAFADAIAQLLAAPDSALKLGQTGAKIIQQDFSFRHYLFDLLEYSAHGFKRVSVVVPNYNYAHYLEQRLLSIINQCYPVFEIIILDDVSSDNSLEVIAQTLADTSIDYQLIKNQHNSGSVFKQWQRGIELARGDYIWICEADDVADTEFISRCIEAFEDPQVVIAYSQSNQIDQDGHEIAINYLDYTDDICTQKWRRNYLIDGTEDLAHAQAIKNTLPNVSAVLFSKAVISEALSECAAPLAKLRIAGDWLIYAHILQQGKIGYIADALNSHRRHQGSVTASSSSNARHLAEIIFMQDYVAHLCNLDPQTIQKAADYAAKIYQQFKLDNRHQDNPRQNKEVKQLLEELLKTVSWGETVEYH